MLGPILQARPRVRSALLDYKGFQGEVWAIAEGTPVFAGFGWRRDGHPLMIGDRPMKLHTPLMNVRTDMITAKLIETPWLSFINYMSMVASKAARVVEAAKGKPVLEFGQRRTHPEAAVDASWAAYVAGCTATSNMEAWYRFAIPAVGTMDHFMVMAGERDGLSKAESEFLAFSDFYTTFPNDAILLVDTYNVAQGIDNAVRATNGKLKGIRLDSNVTHHNVEQAKAQLRLLGAPDAQVFVSDGLDEFKVDALCDVADGFGVGENIVCSPDSAVGIGAVAKLTRNGYGRAVMKISAGSEKMTLPGDIQVYRHHDYDYLALMEEPVTSGVPLLEKVWDEGGARYTPGATAVTAARATLKAELASLPEEIKMLGPCTARRLVVSDALAELIEKTAAQEGSRHEPR